MRVPLLTEEEIAGHLAQVPGWARVGEVSYLWMLRLLLPAPLIV